MEEYHCSYSPTELSYAAAILGLHYLPVAEGRLTLRQMIS